MSNSTSSTSQSRTTSFSSISSNSTTSMTMTTPSIKHQQAPIFISPNAISNLKGKQFYHHGPPQLPPPHSGLGIPFQSQAPFCFPPHHGLPTPPLGELSPPIRAARYDEDRHSSSSNHTFMHLNLGNLCSPETTVQILVVEDGICQAFPIHSELLASHSPYFRALLAKGKEEVCKSKTAVVASHMLRREWRWEDAGELATMHVNDGRVEVEVVIKLPIPVSVTTEDSGSVQVRQYHLNTNEVGEVKRMVFAGFVDWLYHGYEGFHLFPTSINALGPTSLIQLWVFAGRAGIPALQNDCIEGIEWWRRQTGTVQLGDIAWVYEHTKAPCKLRKLLIDQCAWKVHRDWGMEDAESGFPREALFDMLREMRLLFRANAIFGMHEPPFSCLEWRQLRYWQAVGEGFEGRE